MSQYGLDQKNINLDEITENSLKNLALFEVIKTGVLSKDDVTRYNCYQILLRLSEEHPDFLYLHWDYFYKMLKSNNNYHQNIAINILANLSMVDVENRFEDIFEDYYHILAGERTITASHVALNSSTIYINKPELRSIIIDQLLNIDNIHRGKQKELVKAYAIESLLKIYPHEEDKKRIDDFVKSQLKSSSPKTRNMAACFMEKCL
ncbi:MAG TPA: hypothetical protein PKI66_04285 [Methanobacteriaceae archaeon]|nr:hypothetical protein [Methanobacteriaceae archaeon]HNS25849.1 hypothetical protein [Methanobacteriaceae archaeon]